MSKMFVYYKGTVDSFKSVASQYDNKIVFIKGGADGNGAAVYTHGQYFGDVKDALAALTAQVNGLKYFSGVKAGDVTATAAGKDGIITFNAADPALVTVDADAKGVNIGLSKTFTDKVDANTSGLAGETTRATEAEGKIRTDLGQKTDSADANGSAFARIAKLAADINAMTGGNGSISEQINAAIALLDVDVVGGGEGEYIASVSQVDGKVVATKGTFNFDVAGSAAGVKTEVIGNSADAAEANTIYGAKAFATAAANKALDDAEAYADGLAKNYDAAGAATQALKDAKAYADGLAVNYDAAGSAATAEQNAKNHAEGLVGEGSAVDTRFNTVEGKVSTLVGDDTNKSVRTIANEELAKQLIPEGAAESLDTLQEIAAWIQAHPGDASEMNEAIQKNAEDIKAVSDDYLKGSDKTELTNAINGKVAQDAYDTKIGELEGADTTLSNRIATLENLVGIEDGEAGEHASLDVRVSAAESDIEALQGLVGEGTVDSRISTAVSNLKGDAADDYNTLGKLEDKIQAEALRADTEEKAIRTAFAAADETTLSSANKHTDDAIAALNVTDTAVENQFVTEVSEAAGKISVKRSAINASQIGITNTESDAFAAETQNVQAALTELASFWEWEVIE